MSRKYSQSKDVPLDIILDRVDELASACTSRVAFDGQFTMRIPAEVDRDADLVLNEVVLRCRKLMSEVSKLRAERDHAVKLLDKARCEQ